MNDDDYAPALDAPSEQPAAAESSRPESAHAAHGDDDQRVEGQPLDSLSEHRGQRVLNERTRAMFRDLASKVRSGEVTVESPDDLVPADLSTAKAPASAPAPPATAAAQPAQPVTSPLVPASASPLAHAAAALPPIPQPFAHAAAPIQPPSPPQPSAAEQRRLAEIEARERKIAEREAELAAREQKLPTREKLVAQPAQTLTEYIRSQYGITDDAEMKDTIADLMTEMSIMHHGVQLPDDLRAKYEGRKALRQVRAYSSEIDRKRAEVAEREAAAQRATEEAREKAEIEEQTRQASAAIQAHVATVAQQLPFLHQQGSYGASIVWEVMKRQHEQGQSPTWQSAAQLVEEHLRSDASALVQRANQLQSLLAPAASVAPAQPAVSPGGAPGPAPTQPAAAAAKTQQPPTTPPATDDETVVGEDRYDRRRRGLRAIAQKHGFAQRQR